MPRANRCYVEGHIWHVTHRCHRRRFLLRFVRDRRAWVDWLYEARRRLGLCVLDYTVTSNHVHLLVRDRGLGVIADSMQLSLAERPRLSTIASTVMERSGRTAIMPPRSTMERTLPAASFTST